MIIAISLSPICFPCMSATPGARKSTIRFPNFPTRNVLDLFPSFGITPYDAEVLTDTQALAAYFESVVKAGAPGKAAANWMQTELLRRLHDSGKEITASPVSPTVPCRTCHTGRNRRKLPALSVRKSLPRCLIPVVPPLTSLPRKVLGAQVSDDAIEQAAREIIAKNPDNVAKFKSGNEGVFKFFLGQVMKATKGQANPQTVTAILRKLLS